MGNGVVVNGLRLDNKGTLRVEQGILDLKKGGMLESSGVLQIDSRLRTLSGSSANISGPVLGDGILHLESILTVNADLQVRNLRLGHIIPNGSSTQHLRGEVTGSGTLTVLGELDWRIGSMSGSGSTIVEGQLMISDPGAWREESYLARTLENRGTGSITAGNFVLGGTVPGVSGTLVNSAGASLTLADESAILVYGHLDEGVVENEGTIVTTGDVTIGIVGNGVVVNGLRLNNKGTLHVEQGVLELKKGAFVDSIGQIQTLPGGALNVFESLNGNVDNERDFRPDGHTRLNGNGTSLQPQFLEVMGQDFGQLADGFDMNFSWATVELVSTYVRLQDLSANNPGPAPEAIYVDTLVLDSQSTLDLNGLKLYARQYNGQGTIIGEVSMVADSGPLIRNSNNPGAISSLGEVDEWTFFGRTGEQITLTADPGSGSTFGVTTPFLQGMRVSVVAPDGGEIAARESAILGERVQFDPIPLEQVGVYTVRVEANPISPNGIGNYALFAFDSSVDVNQLTLNQPELGQLENHSNVDRWSFYAQENDQIRLDVINADFFGLQFDLTGPNGWIGFTDLEQDSPLIALPTTGEYFIEAQSGGQGSGNYLFEVEQQNAIDLVLGQPAHASFQNTGDAVLFRFDVSQPGPISIEFEDALASNRNEIYVGYDSPPNRRSFDFHAAAPEASQAVEIPYATPGVWYVLAYAHSLAEASNFSITASEAQVRIDSVTPQTSLKNSSAVITLDGVGFLPGTQVELIGDENVTATSVVISSTQKLSASFDLSAVVTGTYDVRITTPDAAQTTFPSSFSIIETGDTSFEATLTVPQSVNVAGGGIVYVDYTNSGNVPIAAPLLTVQPRSEDNAYPALMTLDKSVYQANYWSAVESNDFSTSVRIYAQGESPGLLQPGERIRVPIYYRAVGSVDGRDPTLSLLVRDANDTETIDWAAYISGSQPNTIDSDAWQAIAQNLQTLLGATWGDYIETLSANSSYLGQIGREVNDADELFRFVYAQANASSLANTLSSSVDAYVPVPGINLSYGRRFGNSITQRYEIGPFGRGWQAPSQARLMIEDSGAVLIVEPGGQVREFQPDQRRINRWLSNASETGELQAIGDGVYELIESNGFVRRFDAGGRLDYAEDTNGNRITYSYNDSQIDSLTHNSGESISFAYTEEGFISSISDSSGWTTTYAYDVANQLLLSATSPAGTTTYSYVLGQSPQQEYALATIQDPSGVTRSFEYDFLGRLESTYLGSNENRTRYSYEFGRETITNDTGNLVIYSFDQDGGLARVEDNTGHYVSLEYDDTGNLVSLVDSLGTEQQLSWDSSRRLRSIVDELRNEVRFTPGAPNDQPQAFSDPRGNSIRYQYDASGNLLGRIFPDDSIERFEYDTEGNLVGVTNRRNLEIVRTVNELGQLTREDFPDGTANVYTYDVRDRLQSVDNRGDVTTYSYDSADRLTRIDYAKNRWIRYEYDLSGRRTMIEDSTGNIVRYGFDSIGRLTTLRDADRQLIVRYSYDASGRLSREEHANGTTTTYAFDDAGRLANVVNAQQDGTPNSSFTYSYDSVGQRTGMATRDGNWQYEYDAIGQLVRAVFESVNPEILDQDLTYQYDASGNRVRTIKNGVETAYQTNSLNQIVSVGETAFEYDADGNLVLENGPDGITSYRYDIENRLIQVRTPTGEWQYEYDAFGNRIASVVNGERTEFLIDPSGLGHVIASFNEGNELTATYVHGFGLESVEKSNVDYFFDYDDLGSTASLTNANGEAVNTYAYSPFGQSLHSSETIPNDFEFVGQSGVVQEANGLNFMRARFYDPTTGRFISQDPLRLTAGDSNFYRYVGNEVVTYSDPSGLERRFPRNAGAGEREEAWHKVGCMVSNWVLGFPACCDDPVFASTCFPDDEGSDNGTTNDDGNRGGAKGNSFATDKPRNSESSGNGASSGNPTGEGGTTTGVPGLGGDSFGDVGSLDTNIFPPDSDGRELDEESIRLNESKDPNDKRPLTGIGEQAFITGETPIPYRVRFENLGPASDPVPSRPATAPAQRVVISDQISQDLDWSTLAFTQFGFGDYVVVLDERGQTHFETVEVEIDGAEFNVEVELSFDRARGIATAEFQAIDPEFGLPPFGIIGLLPPEDGTGIGQGFIDFEVSPIAGLPTGTEIRNVAEIRFDSNEIISTNQIDPHDASKGTDPNLEALVTIDVNSPTSSVNALPETSEETFSVSWSGEDVGSGIAAFDIYSAVDSEPAFLWISNTLETQAEFSGEVGKTYRFYAVARDHVGNTENIPASPDTVTTVVNLVPWQNSSNPFDTNNDQFVSPVDALIIINDLNVNGGRRLEPPAHGDEPPPYLDVSGDNFLSPLDALIVINALNEQASGEGEAASEFETLVDDLLVDLSWLEDLKNRYSV